MKTKLGFKFWINMIIFGLVGQIAWVVENMNFETFAQDIFSNSGKPEMSYIVTTLMVILSAFAATITTIFAGGLVDHYGKRKPFISIGYILWGITIALFALIPMKAEGAMIAVIAVLLILFDCLMTIAGSTSNDAAFNAWVADNTDSTNRGLVNAILSIFPVVAVVIVFIGLGNLYNSSAESNWLFFVVLGAIPMVFGILGLFILKDSPKIQRSENQHLMQDTFYGFKKQVIKDNKMLYVTLIALCIIGISQQTFFSYLINFLIKTLGLGDNFVIPMAAIIVGAALMTALSGILADKFGKKHLYFPVLALAFIGIVSFFLIQYTDGVLKYIILYVGGILMMGGLFSLSGFLTGTFQDYIPNKCEGRFQGVRMCFTVLIPMIIGPIISLILGLNAMGESGSDFIPPYNLFIAAAIVIIFAIIPLVFVRKDAERIRELGKLKVEEDQ